MARFRLTLVIACSPIVANAADLRITVYDNAHLNQAVREASFDQVHDIFHQAGITVTFAAGDLESLEANLITYPEPPRPGREAEASCRARTDIALEVVGATPRTAKGSLLGTAIPLAREGLNARVFNDRIRDAATRQNADYAGVLAHAIAHEIGHVLLLTIQHASGGIMSSPWTDAEYAWMRRIPMLFTRDQARAMRARLIREGCSQYSANGGNE